MPGKWTSEFSFVIGAVRASDLGYLVLSDDAVDQKEDPHSVFLEWNRGEWLDNGETGWSAVAMDVCKEPLAQMIAMGPLGEVRLIGSGDAHDEQIGEGPESPIVRGPMRSVRSILGRSYAVGTSRQVYRRDGRARWTCIDQSMRPSPGERAGFEDIDGFDASDLYAVGRRGEIWRFDGTIWRPCVSPTNLVLTCVCRGKDEVYIGGQMGTLLRGRGEVWHVVENNDTKDHIWSVAWFAGKLFAATLSTVFSLEGGRLTAVDFGDDRPSTAYDLSASEAVLWSIGAKDVMAFDGSRWTRID